MMFRNIQRFWFWAVCGIVGLTAIHASATEIMIPGQNVQAGQTIAVPVVINEVDNLAGVKLVLQYDPDVLVFKQAERTRHTSSLMHIVNDKKPGVLIVVMAGARGIKGKEIPVLIMGFEVKKDVKGLSQTSIDITDVQLMSDQLKNIQSDVKVKPIRILP
jgi:hypothetical protein